MNASQEYIEIMAPAGSYDSLMAAINAGADSVYFGVGKLNMRSRSSMNFGPEDLEKITAICRGNHVRSYLTLNTVIYDEEIEEMQRTADAAKESGISAVIASDQAVIDYCRKIGMEVHLSTQVNISNTGSLKFYSNYADVAVLARELNLEQIAEISENIEKQDIRGPSGGLMQIEIFVHGAMCMSISGKCYLSLHEHNKSANRGACLQTCRRRYPEIQAVPADYKYITKEDQYGFELEIDNEYIMSPKDLCTIDFLDKIIESGVSVLKIEGRGRSPDYVKTVVSTYKQAVNAIYEGNYTRENIEKWKSKLAEVFNRGFWDGYYLGRRLGEWSGQYGSKATKRKIQLGKATNYYSKIEVASFMIESGELEIGDRILVTGPTTGAMESEIKELRVDDKNAEKAVKGDEVSFPLDFTVRTSDKLFKIVDRK